MESAPALHAELWQLILRYTKNRAVRLVCKQWLVWHRRLVRSVKIFVDRPRHRLVIYPNLLHLTIRGNISPTHWLDLERITTLQSLRFAEGVVHTVRVKGRRPRIPRAEAERRMDMHRRFVAWASRNPHLERLTIEKLFSVSLAPLTQLQRLDVFVLKMEQVCPLTQLCALVLQVDMRRPEWMDLRRMTRLATLRITGTLSLPLLLPPSVTRLSVDMPFIGGTSTKSIELLKNIRCLDIDAAKFEPDLIRDLTRLEELTLRGSDVSANVRMAIPDRVKVRLLPRRKERPS